ncbi:phage major tail tube protein [Pandoraea sp.]|uniref:phage major tail tube protein n=1 Tax=Pandoraea sp. TaxID=1883445 RepID=UPI0011F664C9|nr:phage major tail tube protein [Pandoraea sp.]TAL53810.1 MAG: phage major tail tube protein [Pandoraea sp.]TAM17063.1 MAG: phage major tail tube protein [Pandoraea sp.]
MALPTKLKLFNIFNEGHNYLGQGTELTLPKLSRKMEEYRGGGMNGPVDVDLGMEKLELEHSYGGFMRQIFEQFGLSKVDGVQLRFAGAYQRDDTGEVDAVEVVVRGRHKEIDAGSAKAGDDTEFKVTSSLSYYKLTLNGAVLVEIDLVNLIENVQGEDRLAAQRKAIGL